MLTGLNIKKNYACESQKSLNRRQRYIVVLDFESATINFHKVKRGKEVKRIFPFSACVKMEKHKKEGTLLSMIFGHDTAAYKKAIYFRAPDERENFCMAVHSYIQCGSRAWKLFKSLDASGSTKIGDFCSFLISFASAQNNAPAAPSSPSSVADEKTEGDRRGDTVRQAGAPVPMPSPLSPSKKVSVDPHNHREHRDSSKDEPWTDLAGVRLLRGESVIVRQRHTSRLDGLLASEQSRGTLFLTNYRIMYRDYAIGASSSDGRGPRDRSTEIPLWGIARVIKTSNGTRLRFTCKDYRQIEFAFDAPNEWVEGFMGHINRLSFPHDQRRSFAYQHKVSVKPGGIDGWTIFSAEKEYQRLGLAPSTTTLPSVEYGVPTSAIPSSSTNHQIFRVINNSTFTLSPTYPQLFVIPKWIDDAKLKVICKFRSRQRVPAVVWQHPITKATLSRCAQPLPGISGKRCDPDELLFRALREMSQSPSCLYIADARPYKAAVGNTIMGKGFEDKAHYEKCELQFLNIDNIHAIRGALDKLSDLCSPEQRNVDDTTWLSRLESTTWMTYIRLLLAGALRVAELLEDVKAAVVVHCSDGWDRTSQLTSLAQLLLDPYYRSSHGFAILVEKEWLAFGHKFAERIGHGDPNAGDTERAPIFTQWLDAIWQLTRQFPTSFEFNEAFLRELFDQVTACRFGTFLFNSAKERAEAKTAKETPSIWTYLLAPGNRYKFTNPLFVAPSVSATREGYRLYPSCSAKHLLLWEGLHLRYDRGAVPRCIDSLDTMGYRIKLELEQLRAALKAAGIDEKKLMEGKVTDNDNTGIDDSKEATKDDVKEVDVRKKLLDNPPPPPPPKQREQALPGDEPPTPPPSSTNGHSIRSPNGLASPTNATATTTNGQYDSKTIKGPSPLPSISIVNTIASANDFEYNYSRDRGSLPPPPPIDTPPDSPPDSPQSSPRARAANAGNRTGSMSSELGDSIILVASPNAIVDDSPPSSPELSSRRMAHTNHVNEFSSLDTVHEGRTSTITNDGSDDDGDDDDGSLLPLPDDIRPSSASTVQAATAAAAQASALAKAQALITAKAQINSMVLDRAKLSLRSTPTPSTSVFAAKSLISGAALSRQKAKLKHSDVESEAAVSSSSPPSISQDGMDERNDAPPAPMDATSVLVANRSASDIKRRPPLRPLASTATNGTDDTPNQLHGDANASLSGLSSPTSATATVASIPPNGRTLVATTPTSSSTTRPLQAPTSTSGGPRSVPPAPPSKTPPAGTLPATTRAGALPYPAAGRSTAGVGRVGTLPAPIAPRGPPPGPPPASAFTGGLPAATVGSAGVSASSASAVSAALSAISGHIITGNSSSASSTTGGSTAAQRLADRKVMSATLPLKSSISAAASAAPLAAPLASTTTASTSASASGSASPSVPPPPRSLPVVPAAAAGSVGRLPLRSSPHPTGTPTSPSVVPLASNAVVSPLGNRLAGTGVGAPTPAKSTSVPPPPRLTAPPVPPPPARSTAPPTPPAPPRR